MRNGYDLLKAIAIMLVVVGHVTNHYPQLSLVTNGIYLFHMPLFIALSGAVFQLGCDRGKYAEFLPFFANKIRRLVVPLILTGAFVLAPTLVACGKTNMGWGGVSLDILSGGVSAKHLWYLQVLFLIFLVAWGAKKMKIGDIPFLCGSVIASCVWSVAGVKISFFNAGLVFQYLPFFALGMCAPRLMKIDLSKFAIGVAGLCVLWVGLYLTLRQTSCSILPQIVLRSVIILGLLRVAEVVWQRMPKIFDVVLRASFGIYLYHMTFIYGYRALFEGRLPIGFEICLTILVALIGSYAMDALIRRVKDYETFLFHRK